MAPYMVFSDKALRGLCRLRPQTRDELIQVNGIGEKKADAFGESLWRRLKSLSPSMHGWSVMMASDDKTERTEVSAVPLYQQVMDDLKGEIARGVYASGSRIPSEMELAKYYGVGRITVRRAVEELSRAGYLNRQQGRGTFVCAPKLKRKIVQKGDVQSFSEGCAANDMVAGARLVSRTVVAATREDAAFFGVEPGCELIVVERVRTADGVPVMLENNAFVLADHPYLQTLADKDLTDNSIFALVAEHSGRAPLKSDPCTVEIALADAQAAPLLEVPVGEPLFYMEAYFTDADGRPLLLGRQKIVGSRYVFDI